MKTTETSIKGTHCLYTTTRGSIVKDFFSAVKDRTTSNEITYPPASYNHYGFVVCLENGYISDGNKKLERVLPEVDLSLNQNGGFSLSLWFITKSSPGGVHRFIFKKGGGIDELTPSVGFLPNGENLFVKIISSKHKIESLYSAKVIEPNRLYNVVVSFAVDYLNGLTDISLYVDGLLDSQISIPGEPVHNQGNLILGKVDNLNYGFVGMVADVVLITRVMNPVEVCLTYLIFLD